MLYPETTRSPANPQSEWDAQLHALCVLHDDLDAVIAALLEVGLGDDLLLGRLKKRKLRLKDQIAAMAMQDAPGLESRAS